MTRSLLAVVAAIATAFMPAGESFGQGVPAAAVSASAAGAQATFAAEVARQATGAERGAASYRSLLDRYCVTCHNERLVSGRGGRAVAARQSAPRRRVDSRHARSGQRRRGSRGMGEGGPQAARRHDAAGGAAAAGRSNDARVRVLAGGESWIARPPRTPIPDAPRPLHRLNRAEYRNAVRDLLALEVDVDALLPADDSSYGFDNIGTALRMSQSLLERYLAAARTVSRAAVGSPPPAVVGETYRLATDMQQHDRMDRLPFGTRGGALVTHLFPQEAEYDIQVELGRSRNVSVPHQLEIAVDGEQVEVVTLAPDVDSGASNPYANASSVTVRVPVPAGPHDVGVTFFRNPAALVEQVRLPFQNPRRGGAAGPIPIVSSITVTGPYNPQGAGETPSRARIFACRPAVAEPDGQTGCATRILSSLARLAYRRPVTGEDLDTLLGFYTDERAAGGSFEAGIELALRWLLASPRLPLPRRGAAGRSRGRRRLPRQRPGARVAALVLPLEQHPGRRAAARGRGGPAARSGRAGTAGAADAGRPPRRRADPQLRRSVAAASQPRRHRGAPGRSLLARVRRVSAPRHDPRDGDFLRQHRAGEPAGAGLVDRRLYVPERAGRDPLRRPERAGQPLSAGVRCPPAARAAACWATAASSR